tara:strand:- start:10247 stop:14710 length:4464 start_codon:yes stop_codon:yes gene_type:complete
MASAALTAIGAVVNYVGGSFAAVAAGTASLGQTATVMAVWTTATVAVNAVLTPQIGASGSPTDWQADSDAGIPFVVGRRGVAGNIVHRDEWGPDNRYQSIVTVYSGAGPINNFGTFRADETAVTFGSYGRVGSGTWQDVMWLDTRLGAQPDTALETPADKGDGTVSGTMPQWGSTYKLSGKAASMWTLALDRDRKRYPGGEPRPRIDIEGILGYDPRLDSTYPGGSGTCRLDDRTSWVYSTNPIIGGLNWALGYRENGALVGGIGSSIDGIDVAAYVEAANISDANGWTVSAHFTTKDDKHQVLLGFLQAGGATYANNAGLISCVSRAASKTSIVTISAADTAGPIEIDTAASRLTRINTIIPKCVLESHQWELTPLEPVIVSAYVTEDGAARERGIDYPFVSDAVQGGQLAAYDIVDSREGITGRAPLKPHMRQLKGGDAFTITEAGFVLDGQKCIVVDREFDPGSSVVTITFRSETDAKHAYALGLSPTPPTAPSLTPVDPVNFPEPDSGDWSVVASTIAGANGETRPSVVLTGSVSNAQVDQVEVSYRYRAPDGAGGWESWSPWTVFGTYPATTSSIEIDAVPPGAQVDTRIVYISLFGQPSVTPLDLAAVTVDGSIVASDATAPSTAISDAVAAINTAQGRADTTLAEAGQALAEAAETSLQDSLLNWIEDPTGSDGWLAADGGFIIGKTAGFKTLWTPLDSGAQTTKVLWFPTTKNVAPGVLVQAGVEVAVADAMTSVALEAVWFDAAGSVLSIDELDSGASGRLSGVEVAPTSAASVRFRLVPTASSAANGSLTTSQPLAAFARPDQSTADDYQDPASETVSRFLSIERSLGSMSGSVRQALTENRRARAVITQTMATQTGQDSAVAALESSLLATVAGTYLTQATASATYYTEAQVNSAIGTYQVTVGAVTDTISAHVNLNAGAITDIEQGAAYFSVAVAAGGGLPAIYEMFAGKDGTSISLGGDALYFFTTVGGVSIKAMEVVSGDVRISNDLYADNEIIMAAGGAIRGGATGYLTGTGFFLGYDGAAYKLAVGNPAGQYMAWDGTTLAITGDIARAFGTSGALTIGDLGGGRTGFEILNASGVEAFYADDTGAMRLNGDALPTTRAATAPPTPAPGEWWFDTSDDTQYRWNGTTWDGWGTIGGTWGGNIASIPANLAALVGSEGINNSAVSIGADGALAGAGGGSVTISGLGYVGDLNATVGAAWGSNVTGRPTELTDGRISVALNATGVLQTNIPNASQVPTLSLSKISDAGALAALNSVAAAQIGDGQIGRGKIETGLSLIESGSGVPTPTRTRVYVDTSKSPVVPWVDDATTVLRIGRESQTNALGSNQTITASGSNGRCVLKIKFESVSQVNKIINTVCSVDFQTVAASADTATGQWFVYLSGTDYALDAVVASATALWTGSTSGLTFVTDAGDVVMNASDHGGAVIGSGADDVQDFIGATLGGGDVFVYLALKMTGGSAYIASPGTTMTMVLE